jgi:hypothetical protein
VIDDQVDALAANAVKALGSLWGGLNNVAKTSWGLTTDITKKVRGLAVVGCAAAAVVGACRRAAAAEGCVLRVSRRVDMQHCEKAVTLVVLLRCCPQHTASV